MPYFSDKDEKNMIKLFYKNPSQNYYIRSSRYSEFLRVTLADSQPERCCLATTSILNSKLMCYIAVQYIFCKYWLFLLYL